MMQDQSYVNFLKTHGLVSYLSKWGFSDTDLALPLIYKICSGLSSADELEIFAQFLNKIYEKGYFKSVEDHKKALAAMGLTTDINL